MKTAWIATGVCGIALVFSGYQTIKVGQENQRLQFNNSIYQAEVRILNEEVAELDRKPTYDQGYRDAIIKMGGPQNPGAYQDGFDAAMKVVDNGGYQNGYHACILQFGYQKPETSRWLVGNDLTKKEEYIPQKYEEKEKK